MRIPGVQSLCARELLVNLESESERAFTVGTCLGALRDASRCGCSGRPLLSFHHHREHLPLPFAHTGTSAMASSSGQSKDKRRGPPEHLGESSTASSSSNSSKFDSVSRAILAPFTSSKRDSAKILTERTCRSVLSCEVAGH